MEESVFSKASEINRNDLLEYKEKKINKRVPLVLTYHPSLEKIAGIVRHHWKDDIAKYLVLLSCRLTMEHLCVLQLETALATLVTTWFTLGKKIKDRKERVFLSASYKHYTRKA
jgi:hypothetical protein